MGMPVLYCNRIVLYDNNTMTGRSPVRGADQYGAEPLAGLRPVRGGAPGSIFNNSIDVDVFYAIST